MRSASAPFLYNKDVKIFISYEDPESLAAKCKYVLDHKLAGIMFWEYASDPSPFCCSKIDAGLYHYVPVSKETP